MDRLLLCVLLVGAGARAQPSLVAIGPLPGLSYSSALGVSGSGQYVIGQSGNPPGGQAAFRWSAAGGAQYLGGGQPFGISYAGDVVAGISGITGWRWTPGGGVQAIPGPGPSGIGLWYGVSGDGSTLLGAGALGLGAYWTQATGPVAIGALGIGGSSLARAASYDGSVIVGASSSSPTSYSKAFRWTQAGGMVALGELPGLGSSSGALACSADGAVIVGRADGSRDDEAFRWTELTGMVGLGYLQPSHSDSTAHGVSADGSVIVGISYGPGGPSGDGGAFVWSAAGGMRDLETILLDAGVSLAGWDLFNATGVSADGLTIVGEGWHNGALRAFVAVIPAPPVFGTVLVGLLAVVGRRRPPASGQV